jgi:hypothetical protein
MIKFRPGHGPIDSQKPNNAAEQRVKFTQAPLKASTAAPAKNGLAVRSVLKNSTTPSRTSQKPQQSKTPDDRRAHAAKTSERDANRWRDPNDRMRGFVDKNHAEKREEKPTSNTNDHGARQYQEVMIDGKRLRMNRFKPESMMKIAKNPSCVMVAKRGSGKSVALRQIMAAYADIPGGNVISKSERLNSFFKHYFPDLFIFDKYEPEFVENLLSRQLRIREKRDRREAENKRLPSNQQKRSIDSRAWFIMDDCLAHGGSWKKDENMLEVMMNGRHYDLFYVLTMQYPLGIGPDLRVNFDYIFLFGENFPNVQKKLYEHYAGMFPSFESFKKVFIQCTKNFGCMVINNRVKSDRIEDMVSWWRAEDKEIKEYIGSRSFINYHHTWFDDNYRKREKEDKQHFATDMMLGKRAKKNACQFEIELVDDDPGSTAPPPAKKETRKPQVLRAKQQKRPASKRAIEEDDENDVCSDACSAAA